MSRRGSLAKWSFGCYRRKRVRDEPVIVPSRLFQSSRSIRYDRLAFSIVRTTLDGMDRAIDCRQVKRALYIYEVNALSTESVPMGGSSARGTALGHNRAEDRMIESGTSRRIRRISEDDGKDKYSANLPIVRLKYTYRPPFLRRKYNKQV